MAGRQPMTAKDQNRRIRQEALREQLSRQGHVQHVIELVKKIEEDPDVTDLDVRKYKVALDTRMKLINKYLPDLKAIEHTGDQENPITFTEVVRKVIDSASD